MSPQVNSFKVAKLYQELSKVVHVHKDNDDRDAFPELVKTLKKFQQAQQNFIDKLDKYMHKFEFDLKELEVVKTIVDVCPEFLASKDIDEHLPIQSVVLSGNKEVQALFVVFFAEAALEYGVGQPDTRGGLLVKKKEDDECALQCIQDSSVLKALSKSKYKLFTKQDVLDYDLTHWALEHWAYELAEWLISICPSSLYKKGAGMFSSHLPIFSTYPNHYMFKVCFENAIKYDPYHPTVGGLFSLGWFDVFGEYPSKTNIDLMIEVSDDAPDYIARILSQHKEIPILQTILRYTPHHIERFITNCPHAIFVRDKDHRLPIHVALEIGMKRSISLVSLITNCSQQLGERDPITRLCPGALAAAKPSCELDTIYHLLRMNPDQIERRTRKHLVKEGIARKRHKTH